jgi:hypothetical protein
MFLLLNMLQFASLIPLMHFNISEELSSLLIGNNPFDSVPNLSTLMLKPDWFPEAYSKAKHYGFLSTMASTLLASSATSAKNCPS